MADTPGQGPPTPHQQGTPNPKWGKAERNIPNFAGSFPFFTCSGSVVSGILYRTPKKGPGKYYVGPVSQ